MHYEFNEKMFLFFIFAQIFKEEGLFYFKDLFDVIQERFLST